MRDNTGNLSQNIFNMVILATWESHVTRRGLVEANVESAEGELSQSSATETIFKRNTFTKCHCYLKDGSITIIIQI